MKVEKLKEEKLLREYSVTVPANDINKKIDQKLTALSKSVKMPGFRKGKVPLDMVKKKYKNDVIGEVINEVVNDSSNKAITNNKLKPAVQPKVEITSYEDGKDLTYKISLEVLPEVPDVKFEKINIKKRTAKIGDADINKLLDEVSNNYKDFKPYEKDVAAKKGDALMIDFKGFLGKEAFAGGEGKNYRLELGSNTFIPGFEDQLIGSKKGDDKRVKVKFPESYHSADLAGKDAEFEVKVHDVLQKAKTDINDDFAKKLGHKDLETLKGILKTGMEQDVESMTRVLMKKDLFDDLEKTVKFELPEKMVENELNSIIHQIKASSDYNAGHVHGEDCDHSKDDEKLKKEYGKLAKRRVLLGILVTDVAAKEKFKVSQEEINKALMNEAYRFPGQEQQVIEYYRKNPNAVQSLNGPIIEEKVVDYIFSKAKVSEESIGLDELKALVLENNK